ncbi:hypothetical protein V6N13_113652 [Hibiscus sabdariffa]|uniref:Uncharacterized protein n=1 Tax=Hibiscus sabdariffa TaxID=183260 RepID=A0ABR2TZI5_9ROSI
MVPKRQAMDGSASCRFLSFSGIQSGRKPSASPTRLSVDNGIGKNGQLAEQELKAVSSSTLSSSPEHVYKKFKTQ